MENIVQSNFLPVDSMDESPHKSLDQSYRNFTMPRIGSTNGCCRLCFKGNCHLQQLFPGGYTEELLISKIFECTTVEITFANDPDALICYSCVAKIEEFHRYREQCRSNDIQHKSSKRRLGGKHLTDPPSTLIPAKYVKKEIDSEGFEISDADFFPVDAVEQSYGVLDAVVDVPTTLVADSSGAVDPAIPNEAGVSNSDEDADGDENLLELMPERTHEEFSVSYTDMNEEYENNNEVFCELPIKEEPQDIDDDGPDEWNDFGMQDDDTMDHNSTNLIPLIEDFSYSTNSENDLEELPPYRKVYNGTDLICLMQDGFLYVQVNKMQWRCRIKSCGAAVYQYEYSKELETNGVSHAHNKEVENSTTDEEILRLLENTSTSPPESDDESFHYVKNIRKGSSIVYKGYKYSMKHRNVDGTTYWKCRSYKGNCSAALYQTPNNKFKTVGSHTHSKQNLTTQAQKPYVSSVSTECDNEIADKSSPGKIKLRIARQTDVTNIPTLIHPTKNVDEKKKKPINQKDAQGVVRRSYDYKIVKNANGRIRLHFDGHLYVRESSRKEETGTVVKWRCRRNYDMCGVIALQYEDGLVEVIGDHDHSPIKKTMKIPDNCVGTTAYKLLPTFKGGEALILDGYRYVKAYNKPNGMSLWRCSGLAGVTCRVKIILSTDGVAYVLRNLKHDHCKPKQKKTVHPETIEVPSSTKQKGLNGADVVEKKVFRMGTESDTRIPSTMRSKMDKAMHKPPIDHSGTVTSSSSASSPSSKVSSKLQSMRNFRVIKNKKGNKALIHGGYRYCKVRTRQDGIISWFCRMNKKTCRAGLYQYPDGRLEWISQSRHNHSPTDPTEQLKKITPPQNTSPKKSTYHMDDETFVSNEWYFVRNRKNGITLIHAGYRYHRKGIRVDSTSMWRCSRANQGCRAGIVMHSDETIAKFDDIDHDHPPPSSIMEEETIISGDPDESIKQSSPNTSIDNNGTGAELSLAHFNGCIEEQDDPEANMRSLLSTMLDVSDEPTNTSSDKIVLSPSKARYRYIKNRRLTKSLVFRGYRYSRSSMQIRADGSVKWICQMNKKTCRVSVKVLKDGSLEMDDQKHNHPQLPEDMDENGEDDDDENDTVDSIRNTTFDNNTTNQEDGMDGGDVHDYFFALNRSNGISLIFQRNRFSKENTRPDGSTIWRCMVRSDCVAKAILHANDTCAVFRGSTHHHPPLDELPKPIKRPIKFSSTSSQNQPTPKLPAAKLIVKGNMLIYKQNRLKHVKSFSDGTAVFKCAELDRCTSVVKIQYDEMYDGESSPVVISETAHNHPNYLTDEAATSSNYCSGNNITKTEGKSKRKSPIKMKKYCTGDNEDHGKEYQLFKNDRGHVSLVYKGYRFSLRNHNVNGNSSWKCRANKTCNAYVTFTQDGRVVRTESEVEVMPHNHAINGEYIERGVALEIDELNPPAENLSQFVSNWVNGMYKNELGGKMKMSLKSSTSHNDGKKTICHKNYSYKLQTIKNGREFWRCTMFKARACRAALFCSNNGTIIEYENGRQHNHEAIKPSVTAMQKASSGFRGKTYDEKSTGVVYEPNEAFGSVNVLQKTIKRSHSSMHYDDQSVEESAPPAYQIVKKDGVDTLHYEKHRYVVIICKREANTDEPKRWRCCLWNSRHQCPVELTILATGEIHFETDPTHNHRPPPPESQEMERLPGLNMKGTKKYELIGRKTIVYKGYKFQWKEQRNSWAYYDCVCSVSHQCTVKLKVDSNGLLFECSNESHNHRLALLNDQSDDSTGLNRVKPLSERAIASRQERLANCPKTGSDEYKVMRSCLGNSMLFEGYRYWLHNKLSCRLFVYRCRYQKSKGCPGSVYMDMDTQLMYHRYDAEHNHEPVPEDALVNGEKPADSTSTSDSHNSDLPNSQQLSSSTQDDQSVDDVDERDLASDIDSSELLLQTEVPKIEEENENAIITPNYTFVKNYLNKNQLLYEDYVYEFVPLSYRKDSDKFYSCLFSDCSASVKLLPSGNLKVLKSNQHAHERPDLTDCRDVGRGSTDFSTLSPSGSGIGAKTKILFEGYLYYTNVSQTFQDETKVFHCYSNVLIKEKSKSNARCSASLELLPNNRVIVTGTHHHSAPNLADSDTQETAHTKLMVLDGRSYRYHNTHPDGTIIWQCTDDPKCKAKVYGKPNGKLVYGNAKHVLRHVMPKLSNHSASDFKISLPVTSTSVKTVVALSKADSLISAVSNSIVPNTTGNLRTKWYQGNRYNFYLTRRDGVQYWRCSKRIEEKCEAGILCYPSGTIMSYNSLAHTHPVLNPTWEEPQTKPLSSYSSQIVKKVEPNEEVARNVCKFPLLNAKAANDLFLTYNGVQYSLRKRTSDGVCIYRCRNKPCSYTLIVTKRGKIIPKKTIWHSCEKQPESDAEGIVAIESTTTNAFSSCASGLGFDKPEIEDPDDLVDQNDSTTIEPIVKRIRLDGNIEMVEENKQQTAQDTIVQTVDSFATIINTETDAEEEEVPNEQSDSEVLSSLETGNVTTDDWDHEYLEQEFESTDAIETADSEAEDRQPIDNDDDDDDDDDDVDDDVVSTQDKQTIVELATFEHSRENFTLKASFNDANNE